MVTRRSLLTAAGTAFAGHLFGSQLPHWGSKGRGNVTPPPNPRGVALELEPLPFGPNALAPFIDVETLRFHHDVYHADCLDQLRQTLHELNMPVGNVTALMGATQNVHAFSDSRRSVLALGRPWNPTPRDDMADAIRNYGGAHINHTAFWRFLAPPETTPSRPTGAVAQAIKRDFGSVANFKRVFRDAALGHVGSGWAWLVYRNDGTLIVTTTANEDNPLMSEYVPWHEQGRPILCLDLWEHAYVRQYGNNRRGYITAWWNVVNWDSVDRAYAVVSARR